MKRLMVLPVALKTYLPPSQRRSAPLDNAQRPPVKAIWAVSIALIGLGLTGAASASPNRRAALSTLNPNVTVTFCEGSLMLSHPSPLSIGAAEYLDDQGGGVGLTREELRANYDQRYARVAEFAANATFETFTGMPPAMRVEMYGKIEEDEFKAEFMTAAWSEQPAQLRAEIDRLRSASHVKDGAQGHLLVWWSGEITPLPTDGVDTPDRAALLRSLPSNSVVEILAVHTRPGLDMQTEDFRAYGVARDRRVPMSVIVLPAETDEDTFVVLRSLHWL